MTSVFEKSMASETILLTGATGFVGFRILVFCLRRGYRVRVVLRNLSKKAQILSTWSIQQLGTAANLTFVEIPDISSLRGISSGAPRCRLCNPCCRPRRFSRSIINQSRPSITLRPTDCRWCAALASLGERTWHDQTHHYYQLACRPRRLCHRHPRDYPHRVNESIEHPAAPLPLSLQSLRRRQSKHAEGS